MKIKRILKWTAGGILLAIIIFGLIAYWTSTNDCGRSASAPAHPMKAMVYCDYGTTNLRLETIEKPVPTDDQVLIKVHAASINPLDWHYIEGTPYVMRLGVGLRKPKVTRLGVDYAGTIEAVGRNVSQFKAGDEVFGGRNGAFADYVCARPDRAMVAKPSSVSFDQAAALPIAAMTALQALRDNAKLQSGQTILINGASGGVGTFAVQIAKSFGANVTGVCSTRNLDLVRSLGADQVIDYTKDDFTQGNTRYDVILDNVSNHSLLECRRALKPDGKYVLVGGGGVHDQGLVGPLARPIRAWLLSKFVSQKMNIVFAELNKTDLNTLAELMQSGKMKAVIDRTYKLGDLPDAIRYLEEGHARGKVVITIDDINRS